MSVMTHLGNLSSVIRTAQDMFKELDYVCEVKASEIEQERTVVLSVFVRMPPYDYDKLMGLERVQLRVEQMVRKHGFEIDAMFLPLPYVNPVVVITVRPSRFLE